MLNQMRWANVTLVFLSYCTNYSNLVALKYIHIIRKSGMAAYNRVPPVPNPGLFLLSSDFQVFLLLKTSSNVTCTGRVGFGQCYICSSHSYNLDLTSGPSGLCQIINYILWDSLHVTLVDFKAHSYLQTEIICKWILSTRENKLLALLPTP